MCMCVCAHEHVRVCPERGRENVQMTGLSIQGESNQDRDVLCALHSTKTVGKKENHFMSQSQ